MRFLAARSSTDATRGEAAGGAAGADQGDAGVQAVRELGMKVSGSLSRCVAQPSVCCPGPLRPAVIAPMRRFTRAVVAGERASPMKE